MFGLADLYQLRGRVGRFTRAAKAYLLIPRQFVMTAESQRRLDAIQKFKELGSGFKLAMEDLELRGAGNILGIQQHGYIYSVGFDLYCRLLKSAIESYKLSDIIIPNMKIRGYIALIVTSLWPFLRSAGAGHLLRIRRS